MNNITQILRVLFYDPASVHLHMSCFPSHSSPQAPLFVKLRASSCHHDGLLPCNTWSLALMPSSHMVHISHSHPQRRPKCTALLLVVKEAKKKSVR